MHGNYLHVTVKMAVLVFKVLILISTTVPWYMLTPSESTFLLQLCIYSLSGLFISENALHNTNVPIIERVYVIPPPYYLDWFEIY